MKPISNDLQTHIEGETTTLAVCWKLTRVDGAVEGFTSHDADITYDSVTYEAATGFTPSTIDSHGDLASDTLDVEGMLSSNAISEADILAGLYDYAEIEIFQINYADTTQGVIPLRKGRLGKVELRHNKFVVDVSSMTDRLNQEIGELYSPLCRAKLGDGRCGVTMSPTYSKTGTITSVTDRRNFADSSRSEDDGFFSQGKITFSSGANNGLSMEVKRFANSGGAIELVMPMPYEVAVSDGYTIEAGCDKRFSTCVNIFSNAVNFRGEPHVPGLDKMLETSSTRTS